MVKLLPLFLVFPLAGADLPARYLELMKEGAAQVSRRLAAEPSADLAALEAAPGYRHFPSSVLVAAVLYQKQRDREMLKLAERIGDIVCDADEKGVYVKRLDHHRDTYMWLDAYRILERDLDPARRERWRKLLMAHMEPLVKEVARRQDYPWYQSPFIGTSPNHYALWSSTLYLGGKVFGNKEWESLAGKVMHRLAVEQAPDGFWGEHSHAGPTTNYDYLTSAGVALYYEHSKDSAALAAVRRSIDFHKHFLYPNGNGVETVDDRNRHGSISMWGSFGFSHTAEGRRLAEFLFSRYPKERLSLESLGRIAQNALYYHAGPAAPIPLDKPAFHYQMQVPAGIRKSGPWFVCLSGILATQSPRNQFFLDRQSHISVFHEKTGQIVIGAQSKRQPELATFKETAGEQTVHLPMSSRLQMGESEDSLALAYNSFFAVINSKIGDTVALDTEITPKGRPADASFNLQLKLHAGETLETGGGKVVTLGEEAIDMATGGSIRHHGWTMKTDPAARIKWPVYPFNPYGNGPEKSIAQAVGLLYVAVRAGSIPLVVSVP